MMRQNMPSRNRPGVKAAGVTPLDADTGIKHLDTFFMRIAGAAVKTISTARSALWVQHLTTINTRLPLS